jgi:hypothetical protein
MNGSNSNLVLRQAVTALHVALMRRQFGAIAQLRQDPRLRRAAESVWILMEVVSAADRGETLQQKQLAAAALGVFSESTVSRAVDDLVSSGYLELRTNIADGRSPLIVPTASCQAIIGMRASETLSIVQSILAKFGLHAPYTNGAGG